MGITNKTDGKSADGNMSDKFTQRPKEKDSYSEHDPTGTVEFQRDQLGTSFYFVLGFVVITFGLYFLMQRQTMDLDYERESVYKRLAEREEERRIEEEDRLRRSRLGQFRDA